MWLLVFCASSSRYPGLVCILRCCISWSYSLYFSVSVELSKYRYHNCTYAPLQFFVVDKNDVINCTALSNNQLPISGTKNYAQLGLFYKKYIILRLLTDLGPRSAVGNVSGYRCVSDCRSRGREFDPGPVPYFRGD